MYCRCPPDGVRKISMAYAYWKAGRHLEHATFELFFRKCPFKGEFVIFAGVDQAIRFLRTFKFSESDIAYLRGCAALDGCDPGFFEYLATVRTAERWCWFLILLLLSVVVMVVAAVAVPPLARVTGVTGGTSALHFTVAAGAAAAAAATAAATTTHSWTAAAWWCRR